MKDSKISKKIRQEREKKIELFLIKLTEKGKISWEHEEFVIGFNDYDPYDHKEIVSYYYAASKGRKFMLKRRGFFKWNLDIDGTDWKISGKLAKAVREYIRSTQTKEEQKQAKRKSEQLMAWLG